MIVKKQIKENSSKKVRKNNALEGVVVSDKMQKTIIVSVTRFIKDSKYNKYYKINKKYKAHDENNNYKAGDKVLIVQSKPISKDKKFKVLNENI